MSSREQRSSTFCSCAVATPLMARASTIEQKSRTDMAVRDESANQVVRRQTPNVPAALRVPLLKPTTQQVQYSEQTTYVFSRRRHIAYKEPSDTTILSILSCSSPNVDDTNTTPTIWLCVRARIGACTLLFKMHITAPFIGVIVGQAIIG